MYKTITCFLPYEDDFQTNKTLEVLLNNHYIREVYLLVKDVMPLPNRLSSCRQLTIDTLSSSKTMQDMAFLANSPYILLYTKMNALELGYQALPRMIDYLSPNDAGMVYADHYKCANRVRTSHPVTDYQLGSVRDDFDFGSLLMFKQDAFLRGVAEISHQPEYNFSGLYALRLALTRFCQLVHIREFLYTEAEDDLRKSGEKQFDYVDPRNRKVQQEREQAFTQYLKDIEAYLPPVGRCIDLHEGDFNHEASVIIPVRNRARTIEDAIRSVLQQETDFPFNLIVIDNHSTDGTSEIIDRFAADDRVIHLIPERTDLGIGGCWSLGIDHPECGRFAVQLDSDDLYSGPSTLQTIVNKFRSEGCAMVIGSYRMINFDLETLPPGIIDHKEWTDENGHNNALRINGLGAPRAFYTPLLRKIRVPNTSYGEDYALGLAFSRNYRIGRIYDVLYLCRRWEGNSDAALSVDKVNKNNDYKDSLRTLEIKRRRELVSKLKTNNGYVPSAYHQQTVSDEEKNEKEELTLPGPEFIRCQLGKWDLCKTNHEALKDIQIRTFQLGENTVKVQFNPARAISTCAKLDKSSIEARPCFLCPDHKPEKQNFIDIELDETFQLRVNPFPILPDHLTLSTKTHQWQVLGDKTNRQLPGKLVSWLDQHFDKGYAVFYNGATSGASAPDHFHFQAAKKNDIPFIHDWKRLFQTAQMEDFDVLPDGNVCRSYAINSFCCPIHAFVTNGKAVSSTRLIDNYLKSLPIHNNEVEPRYNLFAWLDDHDQFIVAYFPRLKHRPDCYTAEGDNKMLVSPGALDISGLFVTARKEDFDKITLEDIKRIYKEVTLL